MNMKKIVATAAALSLTAAVAVGGTLAYLHDDTSKVTNTFKYDPTNQNITMDLWEGTYNGTTVGDPKEDKATANEYKIVPGTTAPKNPTVYLKTGTTTTYVYVEVKNANPTVLTPVFATKEGGGAMWEDTGKTGVNGGDVYVLIDSKSGSYAAATEESIAVLTGVTFAQSIDQASSIDSDIALWGYAVSTVAGTDYLDAFDNAVEEGDFAQIGA